MGQLNRKASGGPHFIAPELCLRGSGVLAQAGETTRRHGQSVLLVHGEYGFDTVAEQLRSSFRAAGLSVREVQHSGPCTADAIRAHAAAGSSHAAEVVIGCGGGRVIDSAKGVAGMLQVPCITVPTSPATCSAVTPAVVYYDQHSTYIRSSVSRTPVAVLIDPGVLAAAPDRLLVAGVIDALAKCLEVRFALRLKEPDATTLAALALCDRLELLLSETETVLAGAAATRREALAETALLWPGLIGGLAGEAAKLAAAHAIHNALTLLPGSRASLHGELVSFGILVQLLLEGRPVTAVTETARWFKRLNCPADLAARGCGEVLAGRAGEISGLAVASVAMQGTFPDLTANELERVLLEADAIALNA